MYSATLKKLANEKKSSDTNIYELWPLTVTGPHRARPPVDLCELSGDCLMIDKHVATLNCESRQQQLVTRDRPSSNLRS